MYTVILSYCYKASIKSYLSPNSKFQTFTTRTNLDPSIISYYPSNVKKSAV